MSTTPDLAILDAFAARVPLRSHHTRAVRTSVDLVASVTERDLARPTPCRSWTLYGLLAHMTAQHLGFAAAARGDDDPSLWLPRPLDDDPAAAYGAAAEDVLTAFAVPDLLARRVLLPELSPTRTFSGAQALCFHFIDYVVHSWDVAVTLGRSVSFEEDLLATATVVAEWVPDNASRSAPGASFGPALPVADGSPLDRIVAHLGRSPAWPRMPEPVRLTG